MKKNLFLFVFLLSLVAVGSVSARAEKESPCKSDAEKLCKGVEHGKGRIWNCLKEHKNELSDACKQKIKVSKKKVRERSRACKADKEKFCKDVPHERGKIHACLKQHNAELTPACQKALSGKKDK